MTYEEQLIASGIAARALLFATLNNLKTKGLLSEEEVSDIYDQALGGIEHSGFADNPIVAEARRLLEVMGQNRA